MKSVLQEIPIIHSYNLELTEEIITFIKGRMPRFNRRNKYILIPTIQIMFLLLAESRIKKYGWN
jgi:hypothetical protein